MVRDLNKTPILCLAAIIMSACASSIPPNFQYESSVRGERGVEGTIGRQKVLTPLFEAGVVRNPSLALQKALPDADISVRKWGLRYFGADWVRYQVRLDADITAEDETIKCREVSTETPVGAPTLPELLDNNGIKLQAQLSALVESCVEKAR